MVSASLGLARVEREADTVRLRSKEQSGVELLLTSILFKVPQMDFVGGSVHGGNASGQVWRNGGLLIGVPAILELKDLADENSLGISRVGSW